MSFHYLPPGNFTMGTAFGADQEEIPEVFLRCERSRTVRIDRGFCLQTTEVTNGQFQEFIEVAAYDGGEQGKEDLLRHLRDPQYVAFRGARKPVVFVSWHDAVAFCRWLSKEDGRLDRLPTEEEWEYACKAGGKTGFCTTVRKRLGEYAWFQENSRGCPHQVAQKRPNSWNVYDMLGNVWEWTSSSFPEDVAEEAGLGKHIRHIRGGSFANAAGACRCAARWAGWPPSKRSCAVGFRVLCEIPESLDK
jgi:formylglycine-generating enzyme required for sulfatase activity